MDNAAGFASAVAAAVRGTRRLAIVGIGDELIPADRPGMAAAREINDHAISGVQVFLASTVPESITGPLRKYRPDHVIFLDAAEMGERPGTLAVIGPDRIRASLLTTHSLPLSVVMEYIEQETGAAVTLVGIQPPRDGGENNDSADDRKYLEQNLRGLCRILQDRMIHES